MPNIIVELHDGRLGPVELRTPPKKTAAMVMDACSRKFNMGLGSLSPKVKPNLLLEDEDVVAGGMTYVFTPSAGSQGMHHVFHVMSQDDPQYYMHFGSLSLVLSQNQSRISALSLLLGMRSVCALSMQSLSITCGLRDMKLCAYSCFCPMNICLRRNQLTPGAICL